MSEQQKTALFREEALKAMIVTEDVPLCDSLHDHAIWWAAGAVLSLVTFAGIGAAYVCGLLQ